MKQFQAFIKKEFSHVFRDRKSLLMLFGLPVVMTLLFGFALTNEIKNAKIVVVDYAKDEASQIIIEKLIAGKEFILEESLMDHNQIEDAFKQGDIKLAVVFPANFSSNLAHQKQAQIQVIADATDPNTATALTGYITRIAKMYQQELIQNIKIPYAIDTEVQFFYNPELKASVNYVPGLIALILLLICVQMTAVSIVKEKESGTMEILLVSPFNPFMVLVSKATPYLVLSLVNLTVIILLSIFVLGLPVNGSIPLLYALSTLFIITALALGLLISTSTNSQRSAMLISLMVMLVPTILLTGFMFPLENMPIALQMISNILPSKWYYLIVEAIMIKGLGFAAIWKETLILFVMTLILLFISLRTFKIRLE